MKPGDVLKTIDDSLYLVDEILTGGNISTRRYDLYSGPHGDPLKLPASLQAIVIFNDLEPENDPVCRYCVIGHHAEWKKRRTGSEWFEAVYEGGRNRIAGISPSYPFIRAEPRLPLLQSGLGGAAHQQLLDELLSRGWQVVPERRVPWYRVRLRLPQPYLFLIRREGQGNYRLRYYLDVLNADSGSLLFSLHLAEPYTRGLSFHTRCAYSPDGLYLKLSAESQLLGDLDHEFTAIYSMSEGKLIFSNASSSLLDISIDPENGQAYALMDEYYSQSISPALRSTVVYRLGSEEAVETRVDAGELYNTGIRCSINVPLHLVSNTGISD